MTSAWSSLLTFVQMRRGDIPQDHAYKNYDLAWRSNENRVRQALLYLNMAYRQPLIGAVMVRKHLNDLGQEVVDLGQCLNEWFVWHRINEGELRKWKYRTGIRS